MLVRLLTSCKRFDRICFLFTIKLYKGWEYEDIYLLVDQDNTAARNLYKKYGYKDTFLDDSATCIVASNFNLRTYPCINVCMRKVLKQIGGGNNGFLDAFKKIFGG